MERNRQLVYNNFRAREQLQFFSLQLMCTHTNTFLYLSGDYKSRCEMSEHLHTLTVSLLVLRQKTQKHCQSFTRYFRHPLEMQTNTRWANDDATAFIKSSMFYKANPARAPLINNLKINLSSHPLSRQFPQHQLRQWMNFPTQTVLCVLTKERTSCYI